MAPTATATNTPTIASKSVMPRFITSRRAQCAIPLRFPVFLRGMPQAGNLNP